MIMKTLKFIIFMIVFMGSSSCQDKSDNTLAEIPLTKYSLEGTTCQWTNLNYNGTVIMVNSNEEMNKYVICTDGSYPVIDFSKYTLLLVSTGSGDISKIDTTFFKNSTNQYTLKVTIHLTMAAAVLKWTFSFLTPKISNEATVALDIQQTYN